MEKDFKSLVEIIDAHPDPYAHTPEKAFKAKMDSVRSTCDKPLTELEFYKKVAFVVAMIKDGHSSANFSEFWLKKKRKEFGVFPYEMHLTNDDKLYVLKSYQDGGIKKGARIAEINGISVSEFLATIDPYISYELKQFRNTIIDDNFEKYLYVAFGHSTNTEFKLSAGKEPVVIENMPFKEMKKFTKDNREEREIKISKGEPYDYEKISEGVGVLKIYAFQTSDMGDYRRFLTRTFKKINKDSIHSLVIDIRGNYGGWPKIASNLFHYISKTHFKTMAQSSTKVSYAYRNNFYKRIPQLRYVKQYIPTQRHFVDINGVMKNRIGSFIDEATFFNEEPVEEDFEFSGDCYLLTNRDSYSAASSFASTFQCYDMGIIIGEETGGTKIFRANAIYEALPKTGVRVAMSTTKLWTACFNEEMEGVKPRVEYIPNIFEITSGMDTHLLFVQKLIKQIQAEKNKKP